MTSKKVIRRQQCPICLDTGMDNVAVYEDEGTWCFGCNTGNSVSSDTTKELISGNVMEITTRRINISTCKFFNYQVAEDNGTWIQIANYCDQYGKIVAQKCRTADKKFYWKGDVTKTTLYGQWLWSPNEKLFITIVEGEIDALTVAQVQGCQYPVVSLTNGASSSVKGVRDNLKYLLGFKYVILAFDNDEAGNKATQECLKLFEPGRVRVCNWKGKDANELLLAGRTRDITEGIFTSKVIKPENIVTVKDIIDKVMIQPSTGIPYPWQSLTDITYGFQLGELHIIVAANGVGKTEYVRELMFHFMKQDMKIGLFSFEQSPDSTVRRLVGSKIGSKLHLPGMEWNAGLIHDTAMQLDEKIWMYDKCGSADLDELFNSIRYLAKAKDVKIFIIDNLKGLKINHDFDRAEKLMTTLQSLKLELGITIYLLSHVAKDKYSYQAYVSTSPKNYKEYSEQTVEDVEKLVKKPGMEWETGRMPMKENVDGPSIVCDLADYVFGLARNTTSQDYIESHTTRVKALKCRLDSAKTGLIFNLTYDDNGILSENGSIVHKGIL